MSTPVHVLIIDDEEADRYLLRRLLKRAGIGAEVLEASDGDEGLSILQQELQGPRDVHQLVFVDINMPRVGGFEFVEQFEQRFMAEAGDAIAIFMLSSSLRPDERSRALAHAAVRGYIPKMPKDADTFRAALEPVGNWL